MSIIDDIANAQRGFTLRMGFRDADFVIIPRERVEELQQAIDGCTAMRYAGGHIRPFDFAISMAMGDVRVNGVRVFVGDKFGAGSYTR